MARVRHPENQTRFVLLYTLRPNLFAIVSKRGVNGHEVPFINQSSDYQTSLGILTLRENRENIKSE